jgi:hypothetical protein
MIMIGRPVTCGCGAWTGPLEMFGKHIEQEHGPARPGRVFYYAPTSGEWARQERGGWLRRAAALIGWFASALTDAATQAVWR